MTVDHPLLGRAVLERDAAGRLVQATADGIIQTWEHHDGFVVAHVVTDARGSTRTLVSRSDRAGSPGSTATARARASTTTRPASWSRPAAAP